MLSILKSYLIVNGVGLVGLIKCLSILFLLFTLFINLDEILHKTRKSGVEMTHFGDYKDWCLVF